MSTTPLSILFFWEEEEEEDHTVFESFRVSGLLLPSATTFGGKQSEDDQRYLYQGLVYAIQCVDDAVF